MVETMIEILTCEFKQCICGLCGYSWQTLSKNPPTTPISFETKSSRAVVRCQPWIYLRLAA